MSRKIYIIIAMVFTVVLSVSTFFIIRNHIDSAKQNEVYDNLAEIVEDEPPKENEGVTFSEDKDYLAEYLELYRQNEDMVGWIKVEDTNINYPVVQSVNEPNFYLKHKFDKTYSAYGCPYVQENCDVQKPSDNIIIYGHHMNDGSIQTISRVNRVCEGKDKGLIVDYIGIKKNMNTALKKYTNFESEEFEGVEQSITIVKDQLEVLGQMFHNFNSSDFFNGSPTEQLACLNRAVEYVQLSEELERRFMAAVKRMKQAFNLCSSSEKFSDEDKDYIHFYCAVRSILFKLTKGDAPDIEQMNARVRKMLEGAIQSDGIEELFETGKHISVDIFSDEYMDKINAIQLPNTKIKILQRLLSQAIDEFKKVNKIMGVEFADRLKKVVDEYNNRRRDEAYANEVLDDVAEQLAQLLSELKTEKNSFKNMGIDYEEKAFYDILKAVSKKFEFEYPDDKMIELSKRIKLIVDDKSRYTDWSARDDIKANLQVDLILLLDEFGYPPVTIDDVYKEVLEQAENFKKYAQ